MSGPGRSAMSCGIERPPAWMRWTLHVASPGGILCHGRVGGLVVSNEAGIFMLELVWIRIIGLQDGQ